ncbi:MAG TPA: hypothetical protein PKA64_00905, partial [Myxococcota bacterium]|nr:hypothetical protein [Myxococcota bacterium]
MTTREGPPEVAWPKPVLGRASLWRSSVWRRPIDWRGAGVGWLSPGMRLWNASGSLIWLVARIAQEAPQALAPVFEPVDDAPAEPRRGRPFVRVFAWRDDPHQTRPVRTVVVHDAAPAREPKGWRADMPWDLPPAPDGTPAVARRSLAPEVARAVPAPLAALSGGDAQLDRQ